ncbi:MAG: response regulator transcription factor [Bacteroidia bacterium]|nr:response regulator transcription factor [Bacteroidia bacterium]MDW8089079.1 response regulator transcription factor [Bacteroidia bacterium]
MKPYRVLIVEDEAPARRLLQRYLSQIGELAITEAPDGEAALRYLQEQDWDIVLLDIEMPGLDGISLMHAAQSLPNPPVVIFTTAYAEHAVKAFEGGAVDYLLKPFSLERLRQALQRAFQRLMERPSPLSPTGKLALPRREGHIILSLQEIVGVCIEERTLYVEVRDGQRHSTRAYTLQELAEKLPQPPFLRIARDALINLDAVREVLPWLSGRYKVLLTTGSVYMCSREHAPQLLRAVGLRA